LVAVVDVLELVEILTLARDLLADTSRWSSMHIATDENGRWVPVGHNDAARFNLQGAVIRAAGYRAREAMKVAESALRTCSSETFARTLMSPRPMTHAEALEWLDTAASILAMQMGRELRATSPSGISGFRLKVSEADAVPRRTTGTTDDNDDDE
jgi:hypothetical protein